MDKNNKTLGIIPARFESTRFPGKILVDILGKTMIQRVYEQCLKAQNLDDIIVATDSKKVLDHVHQFGGKAIMTSSKHRSGTDRCHEVIQKEDYKNFDLIVNIQADEPFLSPAQIDKLVLFLKKHTHFQIATLSIPVDKSTSLFNPNRVKVVTDVNNCALYFSRSPIPFIRQKEKDTWLGDFPFQKHLGIYAFRKDTLLKIGTLGPSPLEKAESLEQLRWLENGLKIGVDETDFEAFGIDTPEDLEQCLKMLEKGLFIEK